MATIAKRRSMCFLRRVFVILLWAGLRAQIGHSLTGNRGILALKVRVGCCEDDRSSLSALSNVNNLNGSRECSQRRRSNQQLAQRHFSSSVSLNLFRNNRNTGKDSSVSTVNGDSTASLPKRHARNDINKNKNQLTRWSSRLTRLWTSFCWYLRKWWTSVREGGFTVYVLECENGKYYVGTTSNRKQRFHQHFASEQGGSAWTRLHRPIRVKEVHRRIPQKYALGMESQVTAEYMWKYGVDKVRGAQFSHSREYTKDDLEALVGFLGHFNELSYKEVREALRWTLPRAAPRTEESGNKSTDTNNSNNNNSNNRPSFRSPRSAGSFLSEAPERRRCFRCGKYGHLASDCTASTSKCFRCGQSGHFAADCPTITKDTRTCFKCGEEGHIAAECPNITT